MSKLAYKKNLKETIERLTALFNKRVQDQIFAKFELPNPAVQNFKKNHQGGLCDCPNLNERISFWDNVLRNQADLEDDSMPTAYPTELDQGIYGAVLGGDIRFVCDPGTGWISSMVDPLLNEWTELDNLKFDPDHPWVTKYREQLEIFVKHSKDKFGISHFILIDGLNFIYELRGATQTYLDLYENPEMMKKGIDFAYDLNVKIQEIFFELVPLIEGGTCSNIVQWIPGRIVNESVDPFTMTTVEDFEKWGRKPIEKIFQHFDGGVVHIHSNGRHQLEAVASLNGLKAIYIVDEKGAPPAVEILPELKLKAGNIPLIMKVSFDSFQKKLNNHQLAGGVFYYVDDTPDINSANKTMEIVRKYR